MELDLTRIFVKVVQFNSFSKAAEALRMPRSTVSKSISRLERETGTKLLVRSTRSLALTAAGRGFYEASHGPVHQLEDARKALYGQDRVLTGVVRITAPEDLGTFVVAPAVAKLSALHPMLRFELEYTDDVIDLIKDGFDLAVRIGRARDSGMTLRRAGEVVLIAVASPGYLKDKARIKAPGDLSDHACLALNVRKMAGVWPLRSTGKAVQVPIKARILCNQTSSLLRMALADGGVALVPTYICQPYLDSGRLVRVLPAWSSIGWPVSLISPLAPSTSARLKATVDQILGELKQSGIIGSRS